MATGEQADEVHRQAELAIGPLHWLAIRQTMMVVAAAKEENDEKQQKQQNEEARLSVKHKWRPLARRGEAARWLLC